jgi:hypothetical protein
VVVSANSLFYFCSIVVLSPKGPSETSESSRFLIGKGGVERFGATQAEGRWAAMVDFLA